MSDLMNIYINPKKSSISYKISFKNTQKLFIGNSLQDYKLIKQNIDRLTIQVMVHNGATFCTEPYGKW